MDLAQQGHAGWLIEVVEEVRQQFGVIGSAEIHLECAAGQHVVTVLDAGLLRVLQSYAQHGSPVETGDARLRVLFGDFDAKEPMAGGDVQHAHWAVVPIEHDRA